MNYASPCGSLTFHSEFLYDFNLPERSNQPKSSTFKQLPDFLHVVLKAEFTHRRETAANGKIDCEKSDKS